MPQNSWVNFDLSGKTNQNVCGVFPNFFIFVGKIQGVLFKVSIYCFFCELLALIFQSKCKLFLNQYLLVLCSWLVCWLVFLSSRTLEPVSPPPGVPRGYGTHQYSTSRDIFSFKPKITPVTPEEPDSVQG